MGCFKNIYENNHVPKTGLFKCAVVEDHANSMLYLYDECGSYVSIASASGGYSSIQAQIDAINERLSLTGTPPTSNMVDVEEWLDDVFLETVGSSAGQQNYRVIKEEEYQEVIFGLRAISQEMGKRYEDIDISAASDFLTAYGFTVVKGVDKANATPYVLVYNENTRGTNNYRAWGAYYFNMAEKLSLIISAPHPKSDSRSEIMSLRHAQRQPGAMLALSGVYRTTFDGMKTALRSHGTTGEVVLEFRGAQTSPIPYNATRAQLQSAIEALPTVGAGNVTVHNENTMNSINTLIIQLKPELYNENSPGDTITLASSTMDGPLTVTHNTDEARNYNSLFHKTIVEFSQQGILTVQYHGFADVRNTGVPRGANVVLSDARTARTPVYYAVRDALDRNGVHVLTRYDYNTQSISFLGGPSSGTFTLRYNGQTTAPIQYTSSENILMGLMQSALEALPNIGNGNVSVEISTNNNQGVPTFIIRFVGDLYRKAVGPRIVATSSLDQGEIRVVNGSNVGLAAVTNSQARDIQSNGHTFIHLEVSSTYRFNDELREKLIGIMAGLNLPQLASASFPAAARPGDNPSNAPAAVGRGLRTGNSKVWSPSDHVHPWSNSDFEAGANYIAGRNNINSGNVWRSPMQMRGIVGLGSHYTPGEYNLQAWTNDPATTSATQQVSGGAGTLNTIRVRIPSEIVTNDIENIHIHVTNPLIGSDVYFGIYASGELVAETGDVSSLLTANGYKTLPLTAPVSLSQGYVEVAFFVGSASQLPSFRSHATSAIINGPFSTSGARWGVADTGLTNTLPTTLGNKTAVATGYWIGLS